MDVELSIEQAAALRQALRSYLSDLTMEIGQTDNAEFRRALREERTLLTDLVTTVETKLSATAGADRP